MTIKETSGRTPTIPMDFPDPDIIRVDDTYYMITTTMHVNPGGEILRSHNLVDWEHASFVFDVLDDPPTEDEKLSPGRAIYGQGMWAGSLRYDKGVFHVLFVANNTHQAYHFTATSIEGPWTRRPMKGFYHDCSMLFDDDGRVYVAHGNTAIHLTELAPDCSGPLNDAADRIIVEDDLTKVRLGYEGSHLYKINGRYYLFVIHWPKGPHGRRTEACFMTESLDKPFVGGDVFDDDMGYRDSGVAQGGIVDDGAGHWYSMMFQDHGAMGRMPVLVPVTFDSRGFPVFGDHSQAPRLLRTIDHRPDHTYSPLVGDDDFSAWRDGSPTPQWEWNHVPDARYWRISRSDAACDGKGMSLVLQSSQVVPNVLSARNTLTTRTTYPYCRATIDVDATDLKDGDHTGIVTLLGAYATVEVSRIEGRLAVSMTARKAVDDSLEPMPDDLGPARVVATAPLAAGRTRVRLAVTCESDNGRDRASYQWWNDDDRRWVTLGTHDLVWKMDHFMGCRIGLFLYSTLSTGGSSRMRNFTYRTSPGEDRMLDGTQRDIMDS